MTIQCLSKLYVVVPLTKGYVAIIDREVWVKVRKYRWHVHFSRGTKRKPGQPYARANGDGRKIYLHRLVMNCPEGFHVDHKNHQTLDCRRSNLEIVDHKTNQSRRRNVTKKGNQND